MAQTALKRKIPNESEGYLRIPYFTDPRFKEMTNAERKIYALVFSRSALKKDPNAVCHASYNDIMEPLGIASRSTPSVCLKRLDEKGLITRKRAFHAKTEYKAVQIDADVPVMEMEIYFKTTEFSIPRENTSRKLRDSESLILALISTHTKNPQARCFTGSISQIANILGFCEKTVRAALDVLRSAGLIRCQERFRGCRYTKELHIRAHKAILRTMRHKRRKSAKEPQERRTVQEIAHDTRTARDRFYAALRWQAERKADECRKRLERDSRYSEVQRALRSLDPRIARAELDEEQGIRSGEKERLYREKEILTAKMLAIMAEIGVSPPDLEPTTYCRCKKCSDTGFRPDGKACDCYTSEEDED